MGNDRNEEIFYVDFMGVVVMENQVVIDIINGDSHAISWPGVTWGACGQRLKWVSLKQTWLKLNTNSKSSCASSSSISIINPVLAPLFELEYWTESDLLSFWWIFLNHCYLIHILQLLILMNWGLICWVFDLKISSVHVSCHISAVLLILQVCIREMGGFYVCYCTTERRACQ